MAKLAKRLVAAQGLEGVVEVIQGVIESVDIPEKVDIIISEWMVSQTASQTDRQPASQPAGQQQQQQQH